jgi:hypothetical protein
MKMKVYLADIGMTAKDFCCLIECDYPYFSRIMNGHRRPGKRLAREIEKITDGKVKILEGAKAKPVNQKPKDCAI